ncbi:MAG TPA: hypothetical protein VEK14_09315 [Rhodomicrobium sp.]|nr:hypothetical protein [Rhodomicrobium sp.]
MNRLPRLLAGLFRQASGSGATSAIERCRSGLLRAIAAVAPQAHARSLRLLRENLSAEQREQHERHGYFEVVGGQTGRRYRIRTGAQLNVELLDMKGRPVGELCFMPEGELPVGDVMLAQKLALELFEEDALKVANTFSAPYHVWNADPHPGFGNRV